MIGIRTRFSDEALTVRELDIGRAVFFPCRGNPWPAIPAFVVSEVDVRNNVCAPSNTRGNSGQHPRALGCLEPGILSRIFCELHDRFVCCSILAMSLITSIIRYRFTAFDLTQSLPRTAEGSLRDPLNFILPRWVPFCSLRSFLLVRCSFHSFC